MEHPQLNETVVANRFLVAFNRVEVFMKNSLGCKTHVNFIPLLEEFGRENPWFKESNKLRTFATIRIFLAHNKTEVESYPCVPTLSSVLQIESIATDLEKCPTIRQRWGRHVETAQWNCSLDELIGLMDSTQFSQFPVIRDNEMAGLITYNGIARWLCANADNISVDVLRSTPINQAVVMEEKRLNFMYMSDTCTLREVQSAFALNPSLEAVLATPDGEEGINLTGIVTTWDIVHIDD